MRNDRVALAHLALLGVSITFGGNYVIAKFAFREVSPLLMVVLRTAGTALVLGLVLLLRRRTNRPKIERREFGELFLLSALGISFNMFCFLEGLSRSSATNASIMLVSIPVLTLAFAILMKRERATFRGVVGIVLGLIGALTLIIPRGGLTLSHDATIGNIFLFTGAVSYSVYLVLSKPILSRHDPLVVVTWIFTFAAFTMLPFGIGGMKALAASGLSTSGTWSVAYIIVGATVIPYLLNSWALARVQSSIVAVYILAQPLVAGWLGHVYLGEQLGANAAVAALLIISGVGMAIYRPRPSPSQRFAVND